MRREKSNSTDIKPDLDEPDLFCRMCDKHFWTKAALAGHIGSAHRIGVEEYYLKYFFTKQPLCPICQEKTRFVKGDYSFKKYCIEHSKQGTTDWANENGYGMKIDAGWKKGLTKETNASILKHSISMMGNSNPSFSTEKIFNGYLELAKRQNNVEILLDYKDYNNSTQIVTVLCKTCNKETETTFQYAHNECFACRHCHPNSSKEQIQVQDFIKSLGNFNIIENDRKMIYPLELDIYLPDQKLAFEYNGLFWHSNKADNYHQIKTEKCLEKEVNLVHIFSDEWKKKRPIVESIIRNKLKLSPRKLDARKCSIVKIKAKEAKEFFEANHIAGAARICNDLNYALVFDEQIVSCLSFSKAMAGRYKDSLEIIRFANILNCNVRGSFSKLLKNAIPEIHSLGYLKIKTYADLRFGTGKVYSTCGFTLVKKTLPDYWYTKGTERIHRFTYRAQPGKTEKQVATDAGVFRVFGCGSMLYELLLQ